jgi:hypothetical protein
MMKEFVGSGWERILKLNKMDSFDSLWELDATWFEEPNERRGGWSGVSKVSLKTENGESVPVFLKRQENHNTKVWNSPLKGIPTFYKEFKNIQRFVRHGIPTVEPVYFGFRYVNGKSQAILMTKSLEGFESLDSALYARNGELMRNRALRESLMETVADAVRSMHKYNFQHRCLYGKHIFVRLVNSDWEVRFIDLEKLKRRLFYKQAVLGDLYTLPRRMPGWRQSDKLSFFKIYMQEKKLSPKSKLIWREIHNKMTAKNKF